MGQAKQRGTFEQRKQQAIDRNKVIVEQLSKSFPAVNRETSKIINRARTIPHNKVLASSVAMLALATLHPER